MFYIKCGETEIFNPTKVNELPVSEARISEKLNEGGSMTFTLVKGHPAYDVLEPMYSFVTLYDDDNIVFYGRVMEHDLPSFSCQIKYECEGTVCFLNDSEIEPSKRTRSMTPEAFFRWCIEQHNADIDNDPRRTFTAGVVTVDDKNKTENFNTSSYTKTKDAIQNNLLGVYGGYLRVRYESGVRYLDWVKDYSDSVNPQQIKIGINIIERSFTKSSDDLFTYIRPVGKNGLLLDERIIRVFPEALVQKYGRIVKSVTFSDISNKTTLRTKAEEYVGRVKTQLLCSGDIDLLEMRYIDGTTPMVRIGDRFNNLEGLVGEEFTVTELERDLTSPYQARLNFGNDKTLGSSRSNSISKASSRGRSSSAQNFKHIIEIGDRVTINSDELVLQGQTLDEHYEMIRETANSYESLSAKTENIGQKVTRNEESIQQITGSGVMRNDELLTHFAGTMNIVRDLQGNFKGLEFVDGTMVCDTVDGHTVTVGATIANNTVQVEGVKTRVQTIEGSALWTERGHITGVCGEYDLVIDPVTGTKTLVVKSGGGIKIRKNNTEFGLYHEGNLSGGIIVDKINDNTTTTKILGDRVQITAQQLAEFGLVDSSGHITAGIVAGLINNQDPSQGTVTTIRGDRVIVGNVGTYSGDSVDEWMQKAYHGTGVFAKYLTVKELSADELTTLLANIEAATISSLNVTYAIDAEIINSTDLVCADLSAESIELGTYQMKVIDASVSGNTLTIKKLGDGGELETINFSKATSLTGSWSGRTFTVTASPQGNTKSDTVYVYPKANAGGDMSILNVYTAHTSAADANILNDTKEQFFLVEDVSTKRVNLKKGSTTGSVYAYVSTSDTYNAGSSAGKNSVKVKAFTADSRTTLNDHRTFTYTTDAVNPPSDAPQVDTWYLAGGTSWSSNKTTVYLKYGSSSGTNYAQLEVNASSIYTAGNTAGKNSVKVKAFTADARTTGLNDHRTFTYTTDAPSPVSGSSRSDTWYLAGGTSWSSNKTTVYLKYGSSSGTNYAQLEVTAPAGSASIDNITGTAVGDVSTDSDNPCDITASGTGVESLTRKLLMNFGAWNSGRRAINMYLGPNGTTSDTRVMRRWMTIPTITESCTNPSQNAFRITATCGGSSVTYTLQVNSSGGIKSFTKT